MHIEPLFRSVEDVLKIGFFFVPRFQRPYSWEDQHIDEFWQDCVVDDSDGEYFIGSIVLYKEGGKFGIVDGQQRLTTITMILCAVRDAFARCGEHNLAKGLDQLIVRTNIDNKLQAVLASESTIPYFQSAIQKLPGTQPEEAKTVEEKRLASAFAYISAKIAEALEIEEDAVTLSDAKRQEQQAAKLRRIRDTVLQLKAVALTLDNDVDAYMIFETLNTRGKDLELGDLVRTHLTKSMPQANSTTDQVRSKFDQLRKAFDQAGRRFDDFILHFWLSRYEYTAKRKIYKRLRKTVTKSNAKAFFDAFLEDGYLYLDLVSPSRRKWKREEQIAADSLNALQVFRVEQPIPFVLAVMRAYEKRAVSLKAAKRALRAVENFHFGFTALTSSRSSGGVSQMYSRHALAIAGSSDAQEIAEEIDELIDKLRDRRPSEDEFVAEFKALASSEKLARNKRLVQYVLHRMATHYDGKLQDPSKMTIEHLAPQAGKASQLSDEEIASIGNLAWVTEADQARLGTKKVTSKVEVLKQRGYWVDSYLAAQRGSWRSLQIADRANHLAQLAWTEVWSI